MSIRKKALERVKKLDRDTLQRVVEQRLGDRGTDNLAAASLRQRLVEATVEGRIQLHELAR